MKGSPTTALVLAIVSWFTCGIFLSIPALLIANNCLASGTAEQGTAQAAKIIALVNIVVSVVGVIVWIMAMAGMVAIAGIGAAAGG
ncbi:MAG: hypothetical protein KF812_09780 [Fimbriimonadaceae bacterium]|nr:hypothetical protein [Fimbriimonadaceae bacterium]